MALPIYVDAHSGYKANDMRSSSSPQPSANVLIKADRLCAAYTPSADFFLD